jgi:hypothetical protein
VAFVDRGDTGERAAHGTRLAVVKRPAARPGFVLLPRRRVVARSHAWLARRRRRARDAARRPATRRGLQPLACALLRLTRFVALVTRRA